MNEKHYVLQFRRYLHSNNWETISGPYPRLKKRKPLGRECLPLVATVLPSPML